jgi:phosphohistidine phosphatase
MRIHFLRHATASDRARTDALRKLTSEGKEEAAAAARLLRSMKVRPARLFTSPLVRARQTAKIVSEALDGISIDVWDELSPGASPAAFLHRLKTCADDEEILVVGHSPSMPAFLATLIGTGRGDAVRLSKGGLAAVDYDPKPSSRGQLRWLLNRKQVRLLAARD